MGGAGPNGDGGAAGPNGVGGAATNCMDLYGNSRISMDVQTDPGKVSLRT